MFFSCYCRLAIQWTYKPNAALYMKVTQKCLLSNTDGGLSSVTIRNALYIRVGVWEGTI